MNRNGYYNNWVIRLIIINAIIYFIQEYSLTYGTEDLQLFGNYMTYYLGLTPILVVQKLYLWQFFTYMFLHGGFMHIAFNMYSLLIFGIPIEQTWGSKKFVFYYLFTGIGAGITIFIINLYLGGSAALIPTIGASGAIYGLLLAFGILYPNAEILLFFILPIKAKYLVIIFGGVELYLLQASGGQGNISHVGHLGGILFGLLFFLVTRKKGIKFKTKIAAAKIKKEASSAKTITGSVNDHVSFLTGLLSKLKNSGPGSVTDDEIQHLKYLEIMTEPDDDLCIEEDFKDDDSFCVKCGTREACLIREIKKLL
jgi:membrane associated rhomboid family serine protease